MMKINYSVPQFFEKYEFLNSSAIAKRLKINSSLFRQYISGNKIPSEKRVKEIESCIKDLCKEISNTELIVPLKFTKQSHKPLNISQCY